jgi:hypothetical protein
VVVTAPVTLSTAPVPLAERLFAVLCLAVVRVFDRLRLALALARLRFAPEALARLLPELLARLVLGFSTRSPIDCWCSRSSSGCWMAVWTVPWDPPRSIWVVQARR